MQSSIDQLNVIARIQAPTPSFFKKLRTAGLILAAISTTLVASPVALPAIVASIAGYLAVGGAVLTAVSQTAVESPSVTAGGSYE